ncbi:Uncharacterised protein [Mycolicibacterium vanbaalenii]|uniref:Secreted protein n=1 Tax=Mycolicibacterium vanbaalenii TaxID=110539 RepID=A0A5S9RBA7_MYCVN|nr:Uncharacterised protein [Mycolicibacterium vanbaalenii]
MATKTMSAALLLVGATIGISAPASADPSPTPGVPACVYTLSEPQVVQVGAARMATATIAPFPCSGSITPNQSTVCLKPLAGDYRPQCAEGYGPAGAQVYQVYRPGITYEVTGRGCGSTAPQGSVCSSVGPISKTL